MTLAYVWSVSLLVFLSEILMLVVLGRAGWRLAGPGALGWVAATALVVGACVLWGLFAAPRATVDVVALRYAVKIGLYGAAAALLAVTSTSPRVVVGFAAFVLVVNVLALLPPVADAAL
ncbi:DUF2568 domain-containing protein [Pimelobacter sp. 30-1]|uniref:DUF2568 domain-containing protein n=1 Tax=Pimelobacter sp. 30-1 TaxID=2004991 RepID=UPI001C056D31|nr:DUF2568 domain-containing protein [Pimelobacter sp. 30-1]MBU2696180.1 DUF2568 domain-containing protein [Pimelobacter sp. 30-1]